MSTSSGNSHLRLVRLIWLAAALAACTSSALAQPAGYNVTASSYIGGSGDTDVVRGSAILSDGTVVLAANIGDATPGGLSPTLLRGANSSTPGAIVRLSADGTTVLSVTRFADYVVDLSIDDNDNLYVACGPDGAIQLNSTASSVVWENTFTKNVYRVDAGPTGYLAVMTRDGTDYDIAKMDNVTIEVLDPSKNTLSSFGGPTHYTRDVCIDEASQTVISVGWRNFYTWEGTTTYPVDCSAYHGRAFDGTLKYNGYNWDSDSASDRWINRPENNMADTRSTRCEIGDDGMLYMMFEADGGNHIFRYDPFDIMVPVSISQPDKYHQFWQSGTEPKTFVARYDPATGNYVYGTQFTCRLANNDCNTVRSIKGALYADSEGRVYLGGESAYGLPLDDDAGWLPPGTGDYYGGAWLLVMESDFSQRLFCTRMSPNANTAAIAARVFSGEGTARIAWGGHTTSATDLYLVNEDQSSLQGLQDGFFTVRGPSGDTTPPAAPTGLTATANGPYQIDLDWNDNTEGDLDSYSVYRDTSSGVPVDVSHRIASGVTTSNYSDNSIGGASTYYYVVTALDTSANESAASNEDSASPPSVIAQESFESYSTGSLSGQGAAGEGWAGAWNSNSSTIVDVSSDPLSANGVTGGDKAVSIAYGNENGRREFATALDTSGTTVYISYLLRWDAGTKNNGEKSWLFNTRGNWDHYFFGITPQDAGGDYIVSSGYSSGIKGGPEFGVGDCVMIVLRADASGETVWVNPSSESDTPAVTHSGVWGNFPGVGLTNRQSADTYLIDRIVVGTTFASVTGTGGGDTTPPAAPTNLSATAVSYSQIDLDWDDNTEPDLDSYNVYRDGSPLVTGLTASSYSDTGLSDNTQYCYTVTAMDTSYNESAQSNQACATTPTEPDTTPPAAPTNLSATAVSSSQIDLDWDDNSEGDLDGYNVYRDGSPLVTGLTNSSYSDTGLSAETQYCYTVTAVDTSDNESSESNQACATTDPQTGGETIKINFQPSGSTVPDGYLADISEPFGDRGNGYSYGWDATFDETRDRNAHSDQRYDTLNHVQKSGAHRIWEISLANGDYEVWLVCGDPSYTDQVNDFDIEGTQVLDPDGEDNFDEYTVTVTVSDGRLTIQPGSGASNAKVCFVDITSVGGGDTTPPAAPTGLTATAASYDQIDLNWDDNTEPDLDSYNVYRDGSPLVTGLTASSYSDTGLSAETQYCYTVTAVDTSDNESAQSSQACETTPAEPDTTPPAAPTGLSATAASTSQIDLDWNDNTEPDLDSYNVYRDGSPLVTGLTASSYSDTGLSPDTQYCYTVTAVDTSDNESAQSSQACATTDAETGGLPSPWQNTDVGSPTPGSASYSNGVFTIEGNGNDIWNNADNFHFVYQSIDGDVELIARVVSVENTNAWAKAGVMVRETLAAGSKHAMTVVTPGNGVSFQRRTTTDGSSSHTPGPSVSAPYWVRLVRSGDTFTSYASSDGSSWTEVGSATISMSSSVYVGLPVTSHSDGVLCTAEIDNVSVDTSGGGDTTPPAAPTGLTATAVSTSQIDLDWDDNTEPDLDSYNVYRDGSPLVTGLTASSYSDTGLTASTQYCYTVTAVDTSSNESAESSQACATTDAETGQSPYGGSPWYLPGLVEAEDYDTGGEGVAYHDTTGGNSGGAYRSEDVDIQGTSDTGGGYNVGWIDTGEWVEYTVDVASAGTYDINVRVASPNSGKYFHIEFDGVDVTGQLDVPNTGAWQNWTTVTASGVSLDAGQQVMRIAMDTNGFNVNYVDIVESGGPTAPAAPTGLTATTISDSQIDLDWDDNTEPDLSHYNVYRDTSSGFTCDVNTLLVSNVTGSLYSDISLPAGTTYYYKVTAVNTNYDESGPSNEASATTSGGGGCGSPSGGPTDNPVATFYGSGTYTWTDNITWECVYNVDDYSGTDMEKYIAARDDAYANGGGVVYFPAGTYYFSDDLYLRDGVVIRGATPGTTDAKNSNFAPPTKFEFPEYQGPGDEANAFKNIRTEYPATDSNIGVVWVDINRAGILLHPTTAAPWDTGITSENMVVFGVRTNNVGSCDPGVPDPAYNQESWQRWMYRFTYNYKLYNYRNILMANTRSNDNITDNFEQPGYVIKMADGSYQSLEGYQAVFNYALHYVMEVGKGDHSWGPGTPETMPANFRTGITIRDNWAYGEARVKIMFRGDGAEILDNVLRDNSGKVHWIDPTGKNQLRGHMTMENRGIDFAGYNLLIDGNDYEVYRHDIGWDSYMTTDGEGIMSQECCGGTYMFHETITNNYGPHATYIGLYKVQDIWDVYIYNNNVTAGNIYVNANTNSASYPCDDVIIDSNTVAGNILLLGDVNGSGNYITNNTASGSGRHIQWSCETNASISGNSGFTVDSCQ